MRKLRESRTKITFLLLILIICISSCKTLPTKPELEKVTWHEIGDNRCLTQEEAKKLLSNITKERAYMKKLELLLTMEGYK